MKKGKSKFLSNRLLYTLITLGILMIVSVGVYASAPSTAQSVGTATYGHHWSELSTCANGKILKMVSGAWTCSNDVDTDINTDFCSGGACGDSISVPSGKSMTASSFLYYSDKSLKTNIQQLSNTIENIKKLNGVSFNWKSNGQKSIGLIAQDVEKVYPEVISTNSNGIKSVDYAKLVAVLIEAVKEQQKQIDELKAQIN